MLKSYRVVGWGGGGGPWDFSVSPSPFGLDFGTLDLGTSDSGLTIVFIPPGDEIRHQNYPQKGEENNNLHGEIFVTRILLRRDILYQLEILQMFRSKDYHS